MVNDGKIIKDHSLNLRFNNNMTLAGQIIERNILMMMITSFVSFRVLDFGSRPISACVCVCVCVERVAIATTLCAQRDIRAQTKQRDVLVSKNITSELEQQISFSVGSCK